MKKLILILITLFGSLSSLFAQHSYYYDVRLTRDLFDMSRMETEQRLENYYEGTPYLNNEFIKGVVYTNSKTKYVDVPMRYNIYNDVIEFKTETNNILTLSNPDIVEKIEYGNYNLVYTPFSFSNKVKKGFFNEVIDGKAKLLCKYQVDFKQASEAQAFRNPEPAKFVLKSNKYYIKLGDTVAKPVDSKKELFAVLTDKNPELKTYIKNNKIKIRNAEDLKKLVQYYNSL